MADTYWAEREGARWDVYGKQRGWMAQADTEDDARLIVAALTAQHAQQPAAAVPAPKPSECAVYPVPDGVTAVSITVGGTGGGGSDGKTQQPADAVQESMVMVQRADLEALAMTDFGRSFWCDGAELAARRIRAMLAAAERKEGES